MECRILVEKITTKITTWASRHLSYAGRLVLVNSVLLGLFNFWAQVFLLPQAVIDKITKLCRNFLWGGEGEYKRAPYVAWDSVCLPKKQGGLGIKHLDKWNIACIAKLVWDISLKKDSLWVKWVHGRYIKGREWWGYTPKGDSSWYWKKLIKVKDKFRDYPNNTYKVKNGYLWLLNTHNYPPKHKIPWTRLSLPRHSFTAWLLLHQKLPVLQRIGRFLPQINMECRWCHHSIETQDHLFFACHKARDIWKETLRDWGIQLHTDGFEQRMDTLKKQIVARQIRQLLKAIVSAVIYNIWQARNTLIFQGKTQETKNIVHCIREQITHRILQLHYHKQKYPKCIEFLSHRAGH